MVPEQGSFSRHSYFQMHGPYADLGLTLLTSDGGR
jgi:hypothetical protein